MSERSISGEKTANQQLFRHNYIVSAGHYRFI